MAFRKSLFGSETPNLDMDAVTYLLSNSRRRALIDALHSDELIQLGDVAEGIAQEEEGSVTRESVYVALHQCHAPKLDDHGVAEYDRDRKELFRGENHPEVKRAKEALEELGY